jgi:transmembrane sensor
MKNKDEWRWMTNRFSGKIRPEEDALLSSWINQSDKHRTMYEEALKIWQNSKAKYHHDDPATEVEWLKIKQRIEREETKVIKLTSVFWMRIAASVCVAALVGIYFLQKKLQTSAETLTSTNEVVTFYLPDSSKIWLNTNSRISYPKDFGHHTRLVELQGEAYFEVRHDNTVFSVKTIHANVQVLGTSFNAKDDGGVGVVTVAQGRVSLATKSLRGRVELTAGEVGIVGGESIQEKTNTDLQFTLWRKKNNPLYTQEVKNPVAYLNNNNIWKKNQLNLSVIEGTIVNTATLAAYKNIVLKITYTKSPSGKAVVVSKTIPDTIQPGKKLFYRKNLMDVLTKAQKVTVEIEKAEVSTN